MNAPYCSHCDTFAFANATCMCGQTEGHHVPDHLQPVYKLCSELRMTEMADLDAKLGAAIDIIDEADRSCDTLFHDEQAKSAKLSRAFWDLSQERGRLRNGFVPDTEVIRRAASSAFTSLS